MIGLNHEKGDFVATVAQLKSGGRNDGERLIAKQRIPIDAIATTNAIKYLRLRLNYKSITNNGDGKKVERY